MKKLLVMSIFSVYLIADGLSSKPLPPTIDGVKGLAMMEMAYTNKFKDKDALKKKIATYPSPLNISKVFVKAYLDSDDVIMLKISPKEMLDKLKTIDSKVRASFLNIEKYDIVKNKFYEETIYIYMKDEKKPIKFGFGWVDDRWVLVEII